MQKLSIIIPVYNERKTIASILDAVARCSVSGLEKEIIIVDDGSTDGTTEFLKTLVGVPMYQIVSMAKNCAKGAAVRKGFAQASGDFILIQDADLEYDPQDYERVLAPLLAGQADVVFGSRFVGGRPHRVMFFWHYAGNRFLTTISNIFTNLNLSDMEACYKAFTKKAVQQLSPLLKANSFDIEPELVSRAAQRSLRIYEVGIAYSGRTYAEGKKIKWRDGFAALWTIVRCAIMR